MPAFPTFVDSTFVDSTFADDGCRIGAAPPSACRWVAALMCALLLAACQPAGQTAVFPGYAEGEYIRLAAPLAGHLAVLHVQRGQRIDANAPLFVLEQESERAARQEALARLQRSEAQLANLSKGRRPEEIDAIRAQLQQAEAALSLSTADFKRQSQLVEQKFIAAARLDEARAARERDRARVAELTSQLKVAKLAARNDDIAAARADVKAAREFLTQADWRLTQKSQRAPVAALVADTLYNAGEWVPAGMPVVSLLPDENIKLRFFIPEKLLSTIKLGQSVQVACDGCNAPIDAVISQIASEAEYTAPLIYSKENRAALVFRVEARPSPKDAARLHPGQPIEVRL